MKQVDYLIRGGKVIDSYNGLEEVRDVAVKNGEIVDADGVSALHEIDASGCIVTPGLIDFHCHVGAFVTDLGISGETAYFPCGVTTVVDAGTTGTANYEAFRMLTAVSRLRIKAFLNVSPAGLVTTAYHENVNPKVFKRDLMLRMLEKYSDQLLGLKLRSSTEIVEEFGLEPLKEMLCLAEEANCPVVVHTTNPPVEPDELAGLLRPGDVYAHVFQGKGKTVLKDDVVRPAFWEHQKRGVLFDAANGVNHFCFHVAKKCLEQGFLPDIISTDLSIKSLYNPGKVFSLPFIISKYLALGMPLPEIIKRTTLAPAKAIGEARELGSLSEGTCADLAIHRLIAHPVMFEDCFGEKMEGETLLKTELTMRDGSVVFRQIDF